MNIPTQHCRAPCCSATGSHHIRWMILSSRISQLVSLWRPNIDYGNLAADAPNFIVGQQAEQFLIQCPNDHNGPLHRDYETRKVAA